MMAGDFDRDMGRVEGKLDDVLRRLGEADSSRSRMHERMNALHADMAALTATTATMRSDLDAMKPAVGDVPQIKADVEAMKPEVAMVRRVKAQAGGAILVIGSIGAIASWVVSNFLVEPIKTAFWRAFH